MKQSEYARLLKQMCEHLGLPDAATLLKTGLLRVGGHDLSVQQRRCACFVNFRICR